jgi:hypothetical protein
MFCINEITKEQQQQQQQQTNTSSPHLNSARAERKTAAAEPPKLQQSQHYINAKQHATHSRNTTRREQTFETGSIS